MARERELRERIAADPGDARALRELAELVRAARDRKDEAVELMARYADAAAPDQAVEALLPLARAQVEARRESEAIESLRRCIDSAPDNFAAFDLLGELLRRAGRLEDAVEALARAAELDPEAIRPRAALVTCLDALGRAGEAEEVLRRLGVLGAGNPAVAALVQELMHRRG